MCIKKGVIDLTTVIEAEERKFDLDSEYNSNCAPICSDTGCHPEGPDCGGSITH